MLRDIVMTATAAVLVLAASYLELFLLLGAHPWWCNSVALIGSSIGAFAGFIGRRLAMTGFLPGLLASVLTVVAFRASSFGKTHFAASFAEDMLAGQLWYFGWIATAAFATLTLSLLPRGR